MSTRSKTMELFEAIAKRHSYRGDYTDAKVPREDLTKIVQAGIQAPSGKNEQTTRIIIVDDPEVLADLAEIIDKPVARTAPALIVCAVDLEPILAGISFGPEDCAAAVENMLLSITGLGYASVWLDGILRFDDKAARVGKRLGVPDNLQVRVILPVGVPVATGTQKEKLPFEKRAWFNKYGG